uniref:PA14 domain-containing protein n=1 Tax=Clytia hemisphaerica TaxID=252671 RepID=A0A7M5WQB2_9CNID
MKKQLSCYFYLACAVAILIKTISTHNIIRLPDTNEGIFSLRKKNKRIATTAYKTFEVNELFDCADACVYDTSCKSINVDKNNQPWVCELVADDRNTKDEYVDAEGVDHYDTGWTSLTIITNNDQNKCLVPSVVTCDFVHDSYSLKVETDWNICTTHRAALFNYDHRTGRLHHHCTGYPVCADYSTYWVQIYKNGCQYYPDIENFWHTWRRGFWGYVYINSYCLIVENNDWLQDKYLKIYKPCHNNDVRNRFIFKSIPDGPVYVTAFTDLPNEATDRSWNSFVGDWRFPNNPSWYSYQDDFLSSAVEWRDNYGMRMEAYFIPPTTGNYRFRLACDDMCEFNIGEPKTMVIDMRAWSLSTAMFTYDVYPQQLSGFHYLVKDQQYYVELLRREWDYGDHAEIQFLEPDRNTWLPMTSRFLRRYR